MSASSPRRKRTPRSSAAPPPSAAGAWAASVAEEKPVRYVVQNLERAYGVPVNRRPPRADPLDVLVATVLSQATSDTNSDRTFAALLNFSTRR